MLLKTRLFELHFCRRQFGSVFNHYYVIVSQVCWVRTNNAK